MKDLERKLIEAQHQARTLLGQAESLVESAGVLMATVEQALEQAVAIPEVRTRKRKGSGGAATTGVNAQGGLRP